jgi:DNA repair protein RecO (recombination protein O)
MADKFFMHGMVLSSVPIGENDRRVVLLTQERGKVSAFFRGARRAKSELSAASNAFTFGMFEGFEGRNSITVVGAEISQSFDEITRDIERVYMGYYFLEVADYYAQENLDETERLNLLYITIKALNNSEIPDELVRRIYELRTMGINGEYPNVFSCAECGESDHLRFYDRENCIMICEECMNKNDKKSSKKNGLISINDDLLYVIQYVISAPLNKLYSFKLESNLQNRFIDFVQDYIQKNVMHIFKTEKFII